MQNTVSPNDFPFVLFHINALVSIIRTMNDSKWFYSEIISLLLIFVLISPQVKG